jgi:hypothetical protein
MDPYFEDAAFWEGFHSVLITELMFHIERELPEHYVSNVKAPVHSISMDDEAASFHQPKFRSAASSPIALKSPDAIEVRHPYIEILRMPGYELVSVIELMSPWNKNGAGIGIHQGKRARLVRDGIHFVELDLLRGGTRTTLSKPLPAGDYYANVFRADRAPMVDVFRWRLRDRLPSIPIPLRSPDKDARLNLGEALRTAYGLGRYDRKLRYARPLDPPLEDADARWAAELMNATR